MIFEKDAELFGKDIREPESLLLFSVSGLGWEYKTDNTIRNGKRVRSGNGKGV